MSEKKMCGAHARSTGQPCQAKGLANGRCKNHGGMSTGPTTFAGKMAVSAAASQRMAAGQQERALRGFFRWLDAGGRIELKMLAKRREMKKRLQSSFGKDNK